MPMDSLVFRCPGCQQPFQVMAEQAGQVVRCPGCEEPVQIPGTQTSQNSVAFSNESPPEPNTAEVQQSAQAQAKAEEVLAHGCPECEKPFGIYASMYGSEMACPHCHQTILVQPKTKPPVEKAAKTPPPAAASSGAKQKQQPKKKPSVSKPPVSAQQESKPPKPNQPIVAPLAPPRGDSPAPAQPQNSAVAGSSGGSFVAPTKQTEQTEEIAQQNELEQTDEMAGAPAVVFTPQPVDHLLPPKFSAVDPAFFYRRHQDGSQVLLPSADGSMKVVDNRIVKIEHNGQTYELISSPRYERVQRMVVTNVLAVIICGLLIAIVMTLLNG